MPYRLRLGCVGIDHDDDEHGPVLGAAVVAIVALVRYLQRPGRTKLNDPLTRRIFTLYWRTVSPFVKVIMRATLRAAAKHARA